MKNFLYFFTFSMLFASCDIVVDLDIPEHERVLVVNSILTTDSMINASISHSVGAFDASSISYVNNATLKVYEDGVLLGEMDEHASLSYDSSGEIDSTYVYNFNQNNEFSFFANRLFVLKHKKARLKSSPENCHFCKFQKNRIFNFEYLSIF